MATRGGGCLKIVLGLIFLPMFLGGVALFSANLGRVLTHDSVEAVVVDLIPSVDSDGDTVFTPVYEYEVDGHVYRYQSKVSLGGLLVPDVGDTRNLLYNPDDPRDARVRNTFTLLLLPGLLALIPLLVLVGIIVGMVRRSRRSGGEEALPPFRSGGAPPWPQPEPATEIRETVTAMFMGTETSPMGADGKVRYRVRAKAEIGDTEYRFLSDWLDDDPTLDLMQLGNQVEVRYTPGDPTDYEVVVPR